MVDFLRLRLPHTRPPYLSKPLTASRPGASNSHCREPQATMRRGKAREWRPGVHNRFSMSSRRFFRIRDEIHFNQQLTLLRFYSGPHLITSYSLLDYRVRCLGEARARANCSVPDRRLLPSSCFLSLGWPSCQRLSTFIEDYGSQPSSGG